jgi:hypothetical protein
MTLWLYGQSGQWPYKGKTRGLQKTELGLEAWLKHLISKRKALSSNPRTEKKKKEN